MVLQRFLKVEGDDSPGYAYLDWFSEPQYLYDDVPLGVRCKVDGSLLDRELGNVVPITKIDPSQIMVECEPDIDSYVMIRDSGYNTRPR